MELFIYIVGYALSMGLFCYAHYHCTGSFDGLDEKILEIIFLSLLSWFWVVVVMTAFVFVFVMAAFQFMHKRFR